MYPVDPGTRQVRQGFHVGLGRQPLGLEAPHLGARCRRATETLTPDDGPHRGIESEALGIVHVLVARQPTEYRLPKQTTQWWRAFLPRRPSRSWVIALMVSPKASSNSP